MTPGTHLAYAEKTRVMGWGVPMSLARASCNGRVGLMICPLVESL